MSGKDQVLLIVAGLLFAFSIFLVRPLGDVIIKLAGADHKLLRKWSVDRGYFLGMGLALILSSGISTVALLIATSVAFNVSVHSIPALACGATYFFLIFSLDRWLVSDQTAGFAADGTGRVSTGMAWVRNLVGELLKIAPRVVVVYFASALFADFILLTVFNPEIQEQKKVMEVQSENQFTAQIKAEVQKRTTEAKGQLEKAKTEKDSLQAEFMQGVSVVQVATQQRDAALAEKAKAGIKCRLVPVYGKSYVDPNTGRRVRPIIGKREECPQEIVDIKNAYDAQVGRFPQSQADVDTAKGQVDTKYKVSDLTAYVTTGAEADVRREWADRAPQARDGLLVRMRSLDLLTTKPSRPCDPSVGPQASFDEACVSRYSARAAGLQHNLRFWILFLEMLPVVIKFVTSILPRRGYASLMAARDEEAKAEAAITHESLRNRVRVEVQRLFREERLRMEIETAGAEIELRELERQRLIESNRRIRRLLPGFVPMPSSLPPNTRGKRWSRWVHLATTFAQRWAILNSARRWVDGLVDRLSRRRRREHQYVSMKPITPSRLTDRKFLNNGHEVIDVTAVPAHKEKVPGRRVIDSEEYL